MAKIELKNVDKFFEGGEVKAIENLNLDIKDKEFMVLVGPSGCGKSTTLNLIAGLEFVTNGKVSFDDFDVTELGPKDRKIAMVFQSYALYPHFNVFDNMAFGLKLAKMEKDEIEKRVNRAAKILEIEDLLARKPKELSGGQRQRVALGRAIVRNPSAFLLDEPLSNLDAKLRVTMRAEIKKLHHRLETTFIYVTHDQVEAMSMADRITILNKGKIMQIGSPEEVYNAPENEFVGGFIGSPSMNFHEVDHIKDNGKNQLKLVDYAFPLPDKFSQQLGDRKKVTLGIRPEHITISKKPLDGGHKVIIDVIEYLGADTLVRVVFEKDKDSVIGVLSEGRFRGKIGDEAYIKWAPEVMHLFDIDTKENLVVDIHKQHIQEQNK